MLNIKKQLDALEYGFIIRQSEYIGNECVTISNGKGMVITLTEQERPNGMEPYHIAHIEIVSKEGEWEHIGNYPIWFKESIPSFVEGFAKRLGVYVETMAMAIDLAESTVHGAFVVKAVTDWDWVIIYTLECETCEMLVSIDMGTLKTTIDKLTVKGGK